MNDERRIQNQCFYRKITTEVEFMLLDSLKIPSFILTRRTIFDHC